MTGKIAPPTRIAIQYAENGAAYEQTYQLWLDTYIAHHCTTPVDPRHTFRVLVARHLRHIYASRRPKPTPPTRIAIQHAESGATYQQTCQRWQEAYIALHGTLPPDPLHHFASLVAYHLRHIYPPRRRGRKIEAPQQKLIELFRRSPDISFSDARILWKHWYQQYHGYLPDEPEARFASVWTQHVTAARKQEPRT